MILHYFVAFCIILYYFVRPECHPEVLERKGKGKKGERKGKGKKGKEKGKGKGKERERAPGTTGKKGKERERVGRVFLHLLSLWPCLHVEGMMESSHCPMNVNRMAKHLR